MKPYQQVTIVECGEALVPIPLEQFEMESPHPYEKLGAPYSLSSVPSPYFLRQRVLERLVQAQAELQQNYPGWKISIFDAYRPVEVQQFMVDYTFQQLRQTRELQTADLLPDLSPEQYQIWIEALRAEVYQFWALPSLDPAIPPPHSTGAAIDITLVDVTGQELNMGSPIDEISPRSLPQYFSQSPDPSEQTYHHNRQILAQIMGSAGFQQHPNEWWHFSYGDQLWAWLIQEQGSSESITAQYGRYW
ncbi:MAG: M15 family metallopeptidase [Oscillatoriales cyanobacterium RM1_1_9]|nr:M15 family metallopeptidase [Oscillatoriales cyanobacterium SM2_3_0]NJO47903.1 M15 family metallopeptidase [Oscillatoriales cyanobacterium RM2_1_1]NJO72238.1 M15 family metallopeptidase [Oscillatoriales cyanobacterium RM1_1_9]